MRAVVSRVERDINMSEARQRKGRPAGAAKGSNSESTKIDSEASESKQFSLKRCRLCQSGGERAATDADYVAFVAPSLYV